MSILITIHTYIHMIFCTYMFINTHIHAYIDREKEREPGVAHGPCVRNGLASLPDVPSLLDTAVFQKVHAPT